jgi:TfoX N-terminal domain
MAYDLELANRLREILAPETGLAEKSMFGGLAFLVDGRLAVSASGRGGLLLRVDPDDTDTLVQQPHAQPFVMRGREMPGWLHIDSIGVESDEELASWVNRGVTYARTLPPK